MAIGVLPDVSARQWLLVVMASIALSSSLVPAWSDTGPRKGLAAVISFIMAGTVLVVTMSDAFGKATF